MRNWNLHERQAGQVLLFALSFTSFVIGIVTVVINASLVLKLGAVAGTLIFGGLWWADRQNQRWARPLSIIILAILDSAALILDQDASMQFSPGIFMPTVVALIFSAPTLITLTGTGMYLAVLIGIPSPNAYQDPVRIVIYGLVIFGMVVARVVLDTSLREAQAATDEAHQSSDEAKTLAAETLAQNTELARITTEQANLLRLVSELETPVVVLANGVALVPLLGALDTRRMEAINKRVLDHIANDRSALVIVDLTGVEIVDTSVAAQLIAMSHAIRLLGCNVALTGIKPEMAITIVHLGVSFPHITIAATPQEALERHTRRMLAVN